MTGAAVFDASVVVAALTQVGAGAEESARLVGTCRISAPTLLLSEAANVIRRHPVHGLLSEPQGAVAIAVLGGLTVDLHPFPVLPDRVWSLRASLTADDASYVALAELLGLPLITSDRKLAGAPGLRCEVVVPN